MTGLMPPNILSYIGEVAVPFINRNFPPTTDFNNFNVPTIWIDTNSSIAYILVSKPLGIANWLALGGPAGGIDTLTADTGGAVTPITGNIDILGGMGITTAGTAGTITISSSGFGLTWNEVTTTSASMLVKNGYVANNSALVTLTLPATAAFGDVIGILGKGTGGWTIAQNSGQQVFCDTKFTTIGTGGSVSSTAGGDTIFLLCTTANTEFRMLTSVGNLTLV